MQWNNTDVNNYATSTIHKYLNETYYNTLPVQDREKLGTKAVREEFHGNSQSGEAFIGKLLYGWNTLNANVWLPSLCELLGYAGIPNEQAGTYNSAMQGLNLTTWYDVDPNGGRQFAYFKQFNTSGGGQKLWACGGSHLYWVRSVSPWDATTTWVMRDATYFHTPLVTASHAVHPAVLYNPERPVKQTGLLYLYRQMICLLFSIPYGIIAPQKGGSAAEALEARLQASSRSKRAFLWRGGTVE